MTLLYKSEAARGRVWQSLFAARAPEVEFRIWPDVGAPEDIRYLAVWEPSAELLASLPNLEVLFSVGAGVDQFDLGTVPDHVQVVRMIEPRLTRGMAEYVAMTVLALHRNLIDYIAAQRERRWAAIGLVPAERRRIGIMGLGTLGRAAIEALRPFGFPIAGWSRSAHQIPGVEVHAGPESLRAFLARTDILVCLLPLTADTRGILDARTFAMLPIGAGLINVGRGGHLVESDLLDALETGRISAAVVDVLAEEPPPADHPFWGHQRILMTPHMASNTDAEAGGQALLDNILRHRRGEAMDGVVRRDRGY
jgi:glyoxylate/hydroxypyruvate reductase